MNSQPTPKRSKKKTALKVTLIVLVSLVLLAAVATITFFALFNHYYDKMNIVDPLNTNSPHYSEEPIYTVPDETDDPNDPWITDPRPVTNPLPTGSGSTNPTVPTTTKNPNLTLPPIVTSPDDPVITPPDPNDHLMTFSDKVTNILLIGTDGRSAQERGRSDSMIILSINEETGQIVMTSLMRDIYIDNIPGLAKGNRLNAAYAAGGVSLLVKTIRENFKIQIDKYARINFTGFTNVIDVLGGLDIELSAGEIQSIRDRKVGLPDDVKPGMVHLNGAQVLAFCRCRYAQRGGVGGDFARTLRQREVLSLISDKVRGASLGQLNELLNEFLPLISTNLTQSEILSMMSKVMTYLNYDIKSYSLPISGSWKYASIRKMSVLSIDFKKNYQALEKMIKGTY